VILTEPEFERVSWHDCHLWRLELRVGDVDEDDWTCDLVLGIDPSWSGSAARTGERGSEWPLRSSSSTV